METKQCSNCVHFKAAPVSGSPQVSGDSGQLKPGECRMSPPVLPTAGGFGEWPGVYSDQWCSKFKSVPSKSPGRPQLYTEDGLLSVVTPILTPGPVQFRELHKLICITTPMHGLTAKKRLDGLVASGRLTVGESGYSLPSVAQEEVS